MEALYVKIEGRYFVVNRLNVISHNMTTGSVTLLGECQFSIESYGYASKKEMILNHQDIDKNTWRRVGQ